MRYRGYYIDSTAFPNIGSMTNIDGQMGNKHFFFKNLFFQKPIRNIHEIEIKLTS